MRRTTVLLFGIVAAWLAADGLATLNGGSVTAPARAQTCEEPSSGSDSCESTDSGDEDPDSSDPGGGDADEPEPDDPDSEEGGGGDQHEPGAGGGAGGTSGGDRDEQNRSGSGFGSRELERRTAGTAREAEEYGSNAAGGAQMGIRAARRSPSAAVGVRSRTEVSPHSATQHSPADSAGVAAEDRSSLTGTFDDLSSGRELARWILYAGGALVLLIASLFTAGFWAKRLIQRI